MRPFSRSWPETSKRDARKAMSQLCHRSAFLHALRSGAATLQIAPPYSSLFVTRIPGSPMIVWLEQWWRPPVLQAGWFGSKMDRVVDPLDRSIARGRPPGEG